MQSKQYMFLFPNEMIHTEVHRVAFLAKSDPYMNRNSDELIWSSSYICSRIESMPSYNFLVQPQDTGVKTGTY